MNRDTLKEILSEFVLPPEGFELELEDRIGALEEAQEEIHEAVELIRRALENTSLLDSAEAYIIGHLESWADGRNPYDDTNIPNLIKRLKSGE